MLSGRERLFSFSHPLEWQNPSEHPVVEEWAVGALTQTSSEPRIWKVFRAYGFHEVFRGKGVSVLRRVPTSPAGEPR